MKKRFVYICNSKYFEAGATRNPILAPDAKLDMFYPEYYRLNYDMKLLVTKPATEAEKQTVAYNDYRERYGSYDIKSLKEAILNGDTKNVLLNGFDQAHFLYVAPFLQDSTEVLYLFKCPKINDLSALSNFKNLKCLFIFWNNSLESLWDMTNNTELKVMSFSATSKLKSIDTLESSMLEYLHINSADNCGNKKPMLFDMTVLDKIPTLKHLSLSFTRLKIDY